VCLSPQLRHTQQHTHTHTQTYASHHNYDTHIHSFSHTYRHKRATKCHNNNTQSHKHARAHTRTRTRTHTHTYVCLSPQLRHTGNYSISGCHLYVGTPPPQKKNNLTTTTTHRQLPNFSWPRIRLSLQQDSMFSGYSHCNTLQRTATHCNTVHQTTSYYTAHNNIICHTLVFPRARIECMNMRRRHTEAFPRRSIQSMRMQVSSMGWLRSVGSIKL